MLPNKLTEMLGQDASPSEEGSANLHYSGASWGFSRAWGVFVAQAPLALALGCASLSPEKDLFPCLACRQEHGMLFRGWPFSI